MASIAPNNEGLSKRLDANRYATKKTIAQGMLDLALLTTNASQLKFILQAGKDHQFYTLILSLIIVSIILQVAIAILGIFLGSKLNINKEKQQNTANLANNISLSFSIITVAVNVVISAFDMREDYNFINNITAKP